MHMYPLHLVSTNFRRRALIATEIYVLPSDAITHSAPHSVRARDSAVCGTFWFQLNGAQMGDDGGDGSPETLGAAVHEGGLRARGA